MEVVEEAILAVEVEVVEEAILAVEVEVVEEAILAVEVEVVEEAILAEISTVNDLNETNNSHVLQTQIKYVELCMYN